MYTAACPDRATTAPVYGTVVARFFCSGCRDTGKALYRHPRAVRNQIFSFGRPTNTSGSPAPAALRRLSKPVRRKTGLFRARRPARGGGGRFSAGTSGCRPALSDFSRTFPPPAPANPGNAHPAAADSEGFSPGLFAKRPPSPARQRLRAYLFCHHTFSIRSVGCKTTGAPKHQKTNILYPVYFFGHTSIVILLCIRRINKERGRRPKRRRALRCGTGNGAGPVPVPESAGKTCKNSKK